jgi:hypothetical protein
VGRPGQVAGQDSAARCPRTPLRVAQLPGGDRKSSFQLGVGQLHWQHLSGQDPSVASLSRDEEYQGTSSRAQRGIYSAAASRNGPDPSSLRSFWDEVCSLEAEPKSIVSLLHNTRRDAFSRSRPPHFSTYSARSFTPNTNYWKIPIQRRRIAGDLLPGDVELIVPVVVSLRI